MATYWLIFTNGGVPQTGLTPSFSTWRHLDGTAAGAAPAIAEVDAVNAPGLYTFTSSPTATTYFVADGGAGQPAGERYQADVISPDDFALTETRMQQIVAGVTQGMFRLKSPTYNAQGKMLTATLRLYASAADALNDVNPISDVAIAATYDGDGNMLTYLGQG